jgi:hypothetical protein
VQRAPGVGDVLTAAWSSLQFNSRSKMMAGLRLIDLIESAQTELKLAAEAIYRGATDLRYINHKLSNAQLLITLAVGRGLVRKSRAKEKGDDDAKKVSISARVP